MFYTDQPINNFAEDLLSRKDFIENLANNLLSYSDRDCLTFGLYGNWGSGKTSLLNMLTSHLNTTTQKHSKPIIFKFNPWLISDQNQLFSQFFKQLSDEIKLRDYSEEAKNVGEQLIKYSQFFEPLTVIPVISFWATLLQKTFTSVGNASKNYGDMKSKNLLEIKKALENELNKFGKKIIIIIDDIDRLNNAEIRQIFQLVKSVGDFKNVMYLLAFDKNIVCKALEHVQEGEGEDYLEKIIQVPFEIPMLDKGELNQILLKNIDHLLKNEKDLMKSFDEQYWGNMFHSGFKDFFVNIRDVNRYINALKFCFEPIKHEVNFTDYLAITAIQVFTPDLYTFIKENKDVFCGALVDTSFNSNYEPQRKIYKQKIDDFLSDFKPRYSKEKIIELIKRLFPKVQAIFGESNPGYNQNWKIAKRICVVENFDIYFKFFLSGNEIKTAEVNIFIKNSNDLDLIDNIIKGYVENGKILKFLDKLIDYNAKIPIENIENVLKVLYNRGDFLPKSNHYLFYSVLKLTFLAERLIERIFEKEERAAIYKRIIAYVELSLYSIVYDISINAQQQGEDNPNKIKPESEWILTANDLEDIKKLLLIRIEEWACNGKLEQHREVDQLLYRWKKWGDEGKMHNFIVDKLLTDKNLPNFLSCFCRSIPGYGFNPTGVSDHVPNITKSMNFKWLSEFAPIEVIEPITRKIKQSENYNLLNNDDKEGIDLFLDQIDNPKINVYE